VNSGMNAAADDDDVDGNDDNVTVFPELFM
jgi:hypothetical protein